MKKGSLENQKAFHEPQRSGIDNQKAFCFKKKHSLENKKGFHKPKNKVLSKIRKHSESEGIWMNKKIV